MSPRSHAILLRSISDALGQARPLACEGVSGRHTRAVQDALEFGLVCFHVAETTRSTRRHIADPMR
jgi:hypothetical protein